MSINFKKGFNWLFGDRSLVAKLFGYYKSTPAPAPTPVPAPAPVPAPTPKTQFTLSVTVNVAPDDATLGIDTLPLIQGTVSGNVASFVIPADHAGWGAQLVVQAKGYTGYSQRVTCPLTDGGTFAPVTLAKIVAPQWTKAQLMDLQGDLMIWMPEMGKPAGMNAGARGVDNGWIWTLTLPWYTPTQRAQIYAKIKGYGFTHVAIQGCKNAVGGGYHNLLPIADQTRATQLDQESIVVYNELKAAGLIPIVAGVAPGPAAQGGAPVIDGFPCADVQVCMSDWDNTGFAAERIKYLADTFPNALIYFERPENATSASGIAVSPNVPNSADKDIANGGQWLKDMQTQCPNFVGMMYEVNNWGGATAACAAEITMAHNGFWRDVQEVRFETNTYDKFWNGADKASYDAADAALQAACPWLKGYMSGDGAPHAPIVVAPPTVGTGAGDLDPNSVTWTGDQGLNIGQFAQTTKITALHVGPDGFIAQFDKRDGPNRWPDTAAPGAQEPGINMGPLEYSVGICCKVNGVWYGSAPIETWNGRDTLGGDVTSQDIGDGRHIGQIAANWFYDARWGALNGYNPKPGEQIGYFVCAGDARNGYCPVKERSNIVLINLPAPGQTSEYTF